MKKISIVCLAFFLLSGNFKGLQIIQKIPIDLSIASLIIPTVYVIFKFLLNFKFPKSLFYTLPLIPLLFLGRSMNTYDPTKTFNFLIVFVACVALTVFIIKSKEDIYLFLNSFCIVGLIICAISLPSLNDLSQGERLTANDVNPIWLARAVSFSFFWLLVLFVNKKIKFIWLLLANVSVLTVMLFAGSKGPMIALLFTTFFVFYKSYKRVIFKPKTMIISFMVLFLLVPFYFYVIKPSGMMLRYAMVFNSGLQSETPRLTLFSSAWELSKDHFLGVGLGNFQHYSFFIYPHNLILESLAELGWPFTLYLLGLIVFSFITLQRLSHLDMSYKGLLGLLLISFINSMVSGDMTSPKELYMCIAISITVYFSTKEPKIIKVDS